MAKWCIHCGRELKDGEVCECTKQPAGQAINYGGQTPNYTRQAPNCDGQAVNYDEYFQLTFSKDAWENAKRTIRTIRENLSENDFLHDMGGPYESNMQITGECVVPTEQEIPIRQYNIAKLSTPLWKRAYGRLQVTNKRVLFRAKGRSLAGPIEIENEFSLEEIGGVEIKEDYRFNLLRFLLSTYCIVVCVGLFYGIVYFARTRESIVPLLILSVVISLAYIASIVLVHSKTWKSVLSMCAAIALFMLGSVVRIKFWMILLEVLGALLGLAGIVMWILSALVDDLHIRLKIKGAHDAIEIGRKLSTDERSGFSVVQPWTDTGLAIRELGALIDDVKRFGNAGVEKWKV